MTMVRSIFLVGMMGAGKTTIGRLLAEAIGFEFVDVDRELESRSGVRIPTIFEIEGEAGFRRREAALLDELTGRERIRPRHRRRRDPRSAEPPATARTRAGDLPADLLPTRCYRRTRKDRARPLLQTDDPRARIEQLLAEREPLYAETAHLTVQSAASNPKRLVQRLARTPEVRAVVAGGDLHGRA